MRYLILATALLLPGWAQAQPFTPAQRAEIVAIVRQALVQDPSILRDAVIALQKDQAQKQVADQAAGVRSNHAAIFDDPSDQVAGNPDGSTTLVEFFDVNCPYCRRMLPAITALLKQRPSVKLVLKDLPVLGPSSVLGAKALLAARGQGGYLALQQALMAEGVKVDDATIRRAATAAGLDTARLETAMRSPAIAAQINRTLALAQTLGIEGTPALVIGGQLIPGAMDLPQLLEATRS